MRVTGYMCHLKYRLLSKRGNEYGPRLHFDWPACFAALVANVSAMISLDGEALHQMRVALRRLRAAIFALSEVVGDDRANHIKTELRWLALEFGPARDLDTLLVEVIKPLRKQHANEPGLVSIRTCLRASV